jgi:hypothetical protein
MQHFLNLWLSLLERSVTIHSLHILSQQFYIGLLHFPVWCQNIVPCQQPLWIQSGSLIIHPIVSQLIIKLIALDIVFQFSITCSSLVLSGKTYHYYSYSFS